VGIANTRRPAAATVLAILQTVIAVMNVAVAAIVLVAMRSPEVAQHAGVDDHAVTLNVVLVVVAAVVTSLAAFGLWKRWAAGWALTLALGLTVTLGMLWGPVFDHDYMGDDDVAVTVAFAVTVVLALVPSVVRWYLRARTVSATKVAAKSAKVESGY
jgi:hypothetical protein